MKNIRNILLLAVAAVLLSSCGGAGMSAPPVSIPAPVTGRIVVGSAEDGSISIVGEAGAVEAGEIVMAENSRLISVLDKIHYRLLDYVVASAFAETSGSLPAICDETGRSCVVAEDDGSFSLFVEGEEGDEIEIVIIDEDGEDKSERITKEVPQNVAAFSLPIVDMARFSLAESAVFILMKGGTSITADGSSLADNKIILASSDGTKKLYSSASIGSSGAVKVASSDEFVVVADNHSLGSDIYYATILNENGDIANALQEEGAFTKFELPNNETDVFKVSDMLMHGSNYIITAHDGSGPSIAMTNLSLTGEGGGPATASFTIANSAGLNHCSTKALANHEFTFVANGEGFTDTLYIVLARFSEGDCSDTASEMLTYIYLYRWVDMLAWFNMAVGVDGANYFPTPNFPEENSPPISVAAIEITNGTEDVLPIDVTFIPNSTSNGSLAGGAMITDYDNSLLHFYPVAVQVEPNTSILTDYSFTDDFFTIEDDLIVNPLQVSWVNSDTLGNRYAVVTLNNGDTEKLDTVVAVDVTEIFDFFAEGTYDISDLFPVGLDPSTLIVEPGNQMIHVGNFKSRNVTSLTVDQLVIDAGGP